MLSTQNLEQMLHNSDFCMHEKMNDWAIKMYMSIGELYTGKAQAY